MQNNIVSKGALALMTGLLLFSFAKYLPQLALFSQPITKETGWLLTLFYGGIVWPSWFSGRSRHVIGILFSLIVVLGMIGGEYLKEILPFWAYFLSFCAGSSLSAMFSSALSYGQSFKVYYLLGISLGLGFTYIPGIHNFEAWLLALMIIISQIIQWLSKENETSATESTKTRYTFLFSAVYWGLLFFELTFWIWSIVLFTAEARTWPLDLALVAATLLLFRLLAGTISSKVAKPGYVFALSLVFMFSVGMAYTLPNPVWFALLFGFSSGILPSLIERFIEIETDQKTIRVLGIALALSSLLLGYYLENHIDYIEDLGLPKQVWLLSARQAWIKEVAIWGGFCVLITGYLYLYRNRWWHQEEDGA